MKFSRFLFVFILGLTAALPLLAQNQGYPQPQLPFSPSGSPLFGQDIVIDDLPDQNQQMVTIRAAFNGWFYALLTYAENTQPRYRVLRSTDHGNSWATVFTAEVWLNHTGISKADLLITGQTDQTIKIFTGIIFHDSIMHNAPAIICRWDGNTGEWEEELLKEYSTEIHDLAFADDGLYPATNSNPSSMAYIYSKKKDYFTDSIYYCVSTDGGLTFGPKRGFAGSAQFIHKVALAYGRSASWPSGRYFAVWEEQASAATPAGHLYTAHTEPGISSPFTLPVLLDGIASGTDNLLRNPAIACQLSASDNDSGNITQVIVCEKKNPVVEKWDITGFCNRKGVSTPQFYNFNPDPTPHNKLQPAIGFNPFDSTFMMTYFDTTGQKLPYLTKNFNMNDPDMWNVLSPGYNDNGELNRPCPGVILDPEKHTGANAWIGRRSNGNGVALFDAPFHYYTGTDNGGFFGMGSNLKLYPNPVSTTLNIQFESGVARGTAFKLYNGQGRLIMTLPEKIYPPGMQRLQIDLSDDPPGVYTLNCRNAGSSKSYKIVKTR